MEQTRLRGHHIEGFMDYIYWRDRSCEWDIFHHNRFKGYGEEFIDNKQRLFERLYLSPNLKIVIIGDRLDDLCEANCQLKNVVCTKKDGYDRIIAKQAGGFIIGKIYCSKDIINFVRKHKKTGKKLIS